MMLCFVYGTKLRCGEGVDRVCMGQMTWGNATMVLPQPCCHFPHRYGCFDGIGHRKRSFQILLFNRFHRKLLIISRDLAHTYPVKLRVTFDRKSQEYQTFIDLTEIKKEFANKLVSFKEQLLLEPA